MKKATAILALLVMVFALAAATAEEEVFTFPNGMVFGMNVDDVKAIETAKIDEIDKEHTHGPVTFTELEYEDVPVSNFKGDVKYLFVGNELVAVRICCEGRGVSYDQVKAELTAQHGEAGPVDLALLGNGIYAVDDDGHLEGKAEAIVTNNVMIIIEQDDDDVDVTFVDLDAAYIGA